MKRKQAVLSVFRAVLSILLINIVVSCTDEPAGDEQGRSEVENLECDPDNGNIQLPGGFCALVLADSVGPARHLVVNHNGDLYVALQRQHKGGGIAALRDTDGDGRADIIQYFSKTNGTGIEIYNNYLYCSSDTHVVRYQLSESKLVPENSPEMIVGGLPIQRTHEAKSFAISETGMIYVNVGAPSNACQEQSRTLGSPGIDPCPQLERHAGIWRFAADQAQQTQLDNGYRFATGIRNAVAIDWNPQSRKLYIVQHGRDQLHQLWPDLYSLEEGAELPAEELFLVEEGTNLGWPYCYYDQLQKRKVLAPEYGGDGKKVGRCERVSDPIMAFPGHYAPNDLLFYTGDQFPERYRGGAFIAFHGSWNRAPLEQKGYLVAFVPFNGGLPGDDWEIFADGFAGRKMLAGPAQARFRPMGLAQGPDGSLYISDSKIGRIWRVIYKGK